MARKLSVEIIGDSRQLTKAFESSTRSAKKFNSEISRGGRTSSGTFKGLGRLAGFAGASIGLAGLGGAVKAFAGEALDAQKVSAQTAAALKSTGGAANVTAKHVDALANSMLKKTGIDDEATKTSENMLLSFTKIRNEAGKQNNIFDQATRSVADLATAMNQGGVPSADQMQKASLQLGKALNDPIKGIGSLSRVGIQFTKQQKDQIKTLVDSGHTLQAQKIILGEVNREMGGRAAAAGKTFQGQWEILKQTVLNLGGAIAQQLMPAVQKLLGQLVKWLNNSKNQKQVLDTIRSACNAVGDVVKVLTGAFKGLNAITGSTKHSLELLFGVLAAYKGLQFASKIQKMAESVGLLGRNARGARGGVANLRGSLLGKAGLVAAAGIASYEITKLVLHLTGLDKKLGSLGGKVYDLFHNTKIAPVIPQGAFTALRRQAARLEAAGLSPSQAAARLQGAHPGYQRHDIAVAAGVGVGGVHINIEHFHSSAPNAKQLESELLKRSKQRQHPRRGAR